MISIKVSGPGNAYFSLGKMLESGVILFNEGKVSHIITELSRGQKVNIHEEVSLETKLPEEKLAQTQKKRGGKPKNEPGT